MTTEQTTTTEQPANVAAQSGHVAPDKAPSKKEDSAKKGASKAQKTAKNKGKGGTAKEGKPKKAAKPARDKEAGALRPDSKGAKVLELISRTKGASLAELMKSTGWQSHSVRGFISGTLGTKMGLKVESAKREDGERVYSLSK